MLSIWPTGAANSTRSPCKRHIGIDPRCWRGNGSAMIADPHPLDFDWRFDEVTVERLAQALRGHFPLLLGAPSVARRLEALGEPVLLVDRQPLQGVRNQLITDISDLERVSGSHSIVFADPPWYPDEVIAWTEVAARIVGLRGEVLVTVWPPNARPQAEPQFDDLVKELSRWSTVEQFPIVPTYDVPSFEIPLQKLRSPLSTVR